MVPKAMRKKYTQGQGGSSFWKVLATQTSGAEFDALNPCNLSVAGTG